MTLVFFIYLPLSMIGTILLIVTHNMGSSGNWSLILYQFIVFSIIFPLGLMSYFDGWVYIPITKKEKWNQTTARMYFSLLTTITLFHYITKFMNFPTYSEYICYLAMLTMLFRIKHEPNISLVLSISFIGLNWILL